MGSLYACVQDHARPLSTTTTVSSVPTRSPADSPAHALSDVSLNAPPKVTAALHCLVVYMGGARTAMERVLSSAELEKWVHVEGYRCINEAWRTVLLGTAELASSSLEAWRWVQEELQRPLQPASAGLAVPLKAGEDPCLTALKAHAAVVLQHLKCAVVLLTRGPGQQLARWVHLPDGTVEEAVDCQTQQVIEALASGIDPVGWHHRAITFHLYGHPQLPLPGNLVG